MVLLGIVVLSLLLWAALGYFDEKHCARNVARRYRVSPAPSHAALAVLKSCFNFALTAISS